MALQKRSSITPLHYVVANVLGRVLQHRGDAIARARAQRSERRGAIHRTPRSWNRLVEQATARPRLVGSMSSTSCDGRTGERAGPRRHAHRPPATARHRCTWPARRRDRGQRWLRAVGVACGYETAERCRRRASALAVGARAHRFADREPHPGRGSAPSRRNIRGRRVRGSCPLDRDPGPLVASRVRALVDRHGEMGRGRGGRRRAGLASGDGADTRSLGRSGRQARTLPGVKQEIDDQHTHRAVGLGLLG